MGLNGPDQTPVGVTPFVAVASPHADRRVLRC